MKKKNQLVKLIIMVGGVFFSFTEYAQNSSKQYLIFKVTNSVIDCPHFGYVIPKEASKKLNIELVEKNHEKKRMVFSVSEKSVLPADTMTQRFRKLLDSLQFPPTMIDKIYLSKNKED